MKKVILSTTMNPEYYFYLPLIVDRWIKIGWEPVIFCEGGHNESWDLMKSMPQMEGIEWVFLPFDLTYYENGNKLNYPIEMIAQVSRLFGACVAYEGDVLLTSDADILPLSDIWSEHGRASFGWDLTEFQQHPMCYFQADREYWKKLMGIESDDIESEIQHALDTEPWSSSPDKEKRWCTDQQILTRRLHLRSMKEFAVIHRDVYPNGYPRGRIDRSAWTLDHEVFIDAHLERSLWADYKKRDRLQELLKKVWPEEDFGWFFDYVVRFAEIELL